MKVTFETQNETEAKQLAKAKDLSNCLWEIVHNSWRKFKHTDYDYLPMLEAVLDELEQYNIKIDDLVEP